MSAELLVPLAVLFFGSFNEDDICFQANIVVQLNEIPSFTLVAFHKGKKVTGLHFFPLDVFAVAGWVLPTQKDICHFCNLLFVF